MGSVGAAEAAGQDGLHGPSTPSIQGSSGALLLLDRFARNAGWTAPDGICCAKLRVLCPSEETVRHER